jgi:hypothetical protein
MFKHIFLETPEKYEKVYTNISKIKTPNGGKQVDHSSHHARLSQMTFPIVTTSSGHHHQRHSKVWVTVCIELVIKKFSNFLIYGQLGWHK